MIQSIQEQRKDTKEKKQNGGKIGGERGIRTLDTLLTYTDVPGLRIQPLCHLSKC